VNVTSTSSPSGSAVDLFEELLSRLQSDPADLEAFLAAHPGHAGTLRGILPTAQALADLSASGTADGSIPPSPSSGADHDASLYGTLGDFRLVRELGRGGMGIVYEAEQIALNRRVALKVLPYAATMDPKQLQRFKNESRAAASLRHEHIVHVYGVGCERGVHYYAMELIEGLTLAQIIAAMHPANREREHPEVGTAAYVPTSSVADLNEAGPRVETTRGPGSVTPATAEIAALSTQFSGPKTREFYRIAARLIADAADALEHAHSLGIVHRDVKPGNLLVDQDGKVYVADFGLARFGPDAGFTMSGDLLGTLRYMPPEQALARHGLVDHRADVYGLGCTLYELLTGRPAVDATERAEILRKLAFEEPVGPRRLQRAIPRELETIALKCLVKNPAERYATAGELAADLRRFLADQPVTARRPTSGQRVRKWAKRHQPAVVTAGVCAVATLVLAIALLAVSNVRVSAEKRQKDDALAVALANLTTAREAVDQMLTEVGQSDLADVPQMEPLRRALLEKALRFYQGFLRDHPTDPAIRRETANAYALIGTVYDELGDYAKAEQALQESIHLLERLADEFPAEPAYRAALARTAIDQNKTFFNLSRFEDAMQAARRAAGLSRTLMAEFPNEFAYRLLLALSQTALGRGAFFLNRDDEAREAFRQAIPVLEQAVRQAPKEPQYRHALAVAYYMLGENIPTPGGNGAGEENLRRAVAVSEGLVADYPRRPRYLYTLAYSVRCLGEELHEQKRFQEADTLYRRSIELSRKAVADFPKMTDLRACLGEALQNLAMNLVATGQREEGASISREAASHFETLVAEASTRPWYMSALCHVYLTAGQNLANLGRLDQAEDAALRAVAAGETMTARYGQSYPRHRLWVLAARAYLLLEGLYLRTGRVAQAAAANRRGIELVEQVPDKSAEASLARVWVVYFYFLRGPFYLDRSYRPGVGPFLERHGQWVQASPYELNRVARMLTVFPAEHDRERAEQTRAVELAQRAVKLAPEQGAYWNTLGVAHYRVGNWPAAIGALERSMAFRAGDDAYNWLFLAMAYRRIGDPYRPLLYYVAGVRWIETHKPLDRELRGFRAEAAAVLGVTEAPSARGGAANERPTVSTLN
jgi:serine/threonine protein kinase/tetratricopeptide (TPR) repeat protein